MYMYVFIFIYVKIEAESGGVGKTMNEQTISESKESSLS